MNCPGCSSSVAVNDRFCEECGTRLEAVATAELVPVPAPVSGGCQCPRSVRQPDQDNFCAVCGKRIHDANAQADAASHSEIRLDQQLAVVSDIGRRHHVNEDAGGIARGTTGAAIMVVADGVSSSFHAQLASAAAVSVVREGLLAADSVDQTSLRLVIDQAHQAIKGMHIKSPDPDMDAAETTVVAALQQDDSWVIGWVGDSRAYIIDPAAGREQLLTRDDSWVEDVVDAGVMTRQAAEANPLAHAITQTLGMPEDTPVPNALSITLKAGQSLLICTDGLWNYFAHPGELFAAFSTANKKNDSLDTCRELVAMANARGGRDNITVALWLAPSADMAQAG